MPIVQVCICWSTTWECVLAACLRKRNRSHRRDWRYEEWERNKKDSYFQRGLTVQRKGRKVTRNEEMCCIHSCKRNIFVHPWLFLKHTHTGSRHHVLSDEEQVAWEFFNSKTMSIEVLHGDTLQRIYFRVEDEVWALSVTLSLSLSLSLTSLFFFLTLPLSLTHTYTHTHTLTLSLTHTLSLSHTHSLPFPLLSFVSAFIPLFLPFLPT